ncbi:MAG: DUF4292 domain-containing protein [Prevotella sp.]|nr:DUF4292 domain-containing protein [Prevotella sp.]
MKIRLSSIILFATAATLLAGCASSRKLEMRKAVNTATEKQTETTTAAVKTLSYVQKVSDNAVYAQNITGSISLRIKAGDKNISVPGSIHMRRDRVIRLQAFIPLLGSEVGRIEFTPEYVLVIDRLHKQYYKEDYSRLDFLRDNGLNFYSLQQLFWNQLLVPGKSKISNNDLKKFAVDLSSAVSVPLTLTEGNMTYQWTTNGQSGQIMAAKVTYKSKAHGTSSLNWTYEDFKNVGVKKFPAHQTFSFTTNATGKKQDATLEFEIDKISTNSNWEDRTTVSPKYKKVATESILDKLIMAQ